MFLLKTKNEKKCFFTPEDDTTKHIFKTHPASRTNRPWQSQVHGGCGRRKRDKVTCSNILTVNEVTVEKAENSRLRGRSIYCHCQGLEFTVYDHLNV